VTTPDAFDAFERAMARGDWAAVDAALALMDRDEARWLQESVFHAKSYQKWAPSAPRDRHTGQTEGRGVDPGP
jgi:hypothetical protein